MIIEPGPVPPVRQTLAVGGVCALVATVVGLFANWHYGANGILLDGLLTALLSLVYVGIAMLLWGNRPRSVAGAIVLAIGQAAAVAVITAVAGPPFVYNFFSAFVANEPKVLDSVVFVALLTAATVSIGLPFHWRLARMKRESIALELAIEFLCVAIWFIGFLELKRLCNEVGMLDGWALPI